MYDISILLIFIAVFFRVFFVLNRYHDQLVATEGKFPIAENQVTVTTLVVLYLYSHVVED